MVETTMSEILVASVVCAALWFLYRIFNGRGSSKGIGVDGKLVWIDKGKSTKPFFNNSFAVLGKPDLLYRIPGGILAVEFKGRHGPVFDSDVVQAKAAALAARGSGYRVVRLLLKTMTTEQYLELPKRDDDLYADIAEFVSYTRVAKAGNPVPARPGARKCAGCAFKNSCQHSARN
jgi:CRISPR/Cas system-associated exonuclease Cas4 (RecB family)